MLGRKKASLFLFIREITMKIQILAENTAREGFIPEHGLSIYIEALGKKLLFDTGSSGIMADHARKLGVELSQVDAVILSHGHYDHGGGLQRFLECNHRAQIYVNRHVFGDYYNAHGKYIGLDPGLVQCGRLVFVEEVTELFPGIRLCPALPPVFPVDCAGLQVMEQGQLHPDSFRHEQYLLIWEKGRLVCFSGCAHMGIDNIAHWFRPHVLVGGFHFKHLEADHPRITDTARRLLDYGCICYTGHCTGEKQYAPMKQIMGAKLHAISTGDTILL